MLAQKDSFSRWARDTHPKVTQPRFYRWRNCLRSHTLVKGWAWIVPRYLGSKIQAFTHYTILFGKYWGMVRNTFKPLHLPQIQAERGHAKKKMKRKRKSSCLKLLLWVGQASWLLGVGRSCLPGETEVMWGPAFDCSRSNKRERRIHGETSTVNCSTHGKQGLMEPHPDQSFIQLAHS